MGEHHRALAFNSGRSRYSTTANDITTALGELDGDITGIGSGRLIQKKLLGIGRILGGREDNLFGIAPFVAGSGEQERYSRYAEKKYFFHNATTK
jgi:hypothetical protein